ncbi:PilZ domain-containing protein [Thermodesulfobacteriota bacterium]
MESNRSTEISPEDVAHIRKISEEGSDLPPWLFKRQNLEATLKNAQVIDQKALINMLNHIHFIDGYLHVNLRHPRYREDILVQACPEPCLGEKLTCHWYYKNISAMILEHYQFLNIVIDDGQSLILVPAVLQSMDNKSFIIELPKKSYAVGQRQVRRYPCREISAELIQSGFQARGELLDFSPAGFRVKVTPDLSSSFRWLNSDELIHTHLKKDQQIIFSGACRCIREEHQQKEKEIVLAPVNEKIKRFKKNQARNLRQKLIPSPTLVFEHPLLKKRVHLVVYDISTSGFSVYETGDMRFLIPGMIIPELTISFSGAIKIVCAAQVIYRLEEEDNGSRCGLAILDMDINSYSRLTQILTNVLEPHAYVSSEVDMDALWEFFFDTGFIYPKKYRLIQSNRDTFKETYRKLYQENPEIAKHFTYQKNGRIYGHISMIRAYERAWMVHHHAARAVESRRIGFIVLKALMHYLNDLHRLPSAKMDYAICYFRPENKFPDRVFGGFARSLENRQGCSTDLFAYLPYPSLILDARFPEGWSLERSSAIDIWNLKRFYNHHSGGLLLEALGLDQENVGSESLKDVYNRLDLLREWRVYSLTHNGELNAVLIVNQSDLGINLSDLLSCIKIIVTNPAELPWDVLSIAISRLTRDNQLERVPVMFYPFEYVIDNDIPYEKRYQLWVLNVEYGNKYMEYMRKRFRVGYK